MNAHETSPTGAGGDLPPGWTVRPATQADLPTVVALIRALDEHLLGTSDITEEELGAGWEQLDLERDTWLVETPGGEAAGYADFTRRGEHLRLHGDGYVHPRWFGHGVGVTLVRAFEARAREDLGLAPADMRVALLSGIIGSDERAHALFRQEGFTVTRHFWRMDIAFTEPPPAPSLPEGITVRAVETPEDEARLFEATDEAFRDHWGWTPQQAEDWLTRKKAGGYDPGLWFLAEDGGEVAGTAVCGVQGGVAFVSDLAVRRAWRRRGLGRALLLHAFGELHRRGETAVQLGVDAANPTGATALYESVGMRATQAYAIYEKELRPGRAWSED